MKILIIDGGLQGLSCGESLKDDNEVFILTEDNLQCKKSHFFKKAFIAEYVTEEATIKVLSKERFDVIIPVSDMTIPFCSKNKYEWELRFKTKVAVPDYDCVYQVEDKKRFMTFCLEHDIPHPNTIALNNDNLAEAAQEVGFPALIKPDYSVGARGITRVNNLKDLKRHFPRIAKVFGSCTLQEFIDNQEYYFNVMMFRDAQGRILASVVIKIVRMYPVKAGSSSCCVSVENEDLTALCKDALDKLNWVGMADFDVLQRLDNGEYKIIEINPRVPASLRAAAISGVNFPEIIVRDAMGMPLKDYKYMTGKWMRYLGIDIMWLFKTKQFFGNTPSWWKFIGSDLYYQDIYANDASTWWTWLAEGLSKLGKRNKKLR